MYWLMRLKMPLKTGLFRSRSRASQIRRSRSRFIIALSGEPFLTDHLCHHEACQDWQRRSRTSSAHSLPCALKSGDRGYIRPNSLKEVWFCCHLYADVREVCAPMVTGLRWTQARLAFLCLDAGDSMKALLKVLEITLIADVASRLTSDASRIGDLLAKQNASTSSLARVRAIDFKPVG